MSRQSNFYFIRTKKAILQNENCWFCHFLSELLKTRLCNKKWSFLGIFWFECWICCSFLPLAAWHGHIQAASRITTRARRGLLLPSWSRQWFRFWAGWECSCKGLSTGSIGQLHQGAESSILYVRTWYCSPPVWFASATRWLCGLDVSIGRSAGTPVYSMIHFFFLTKMHFFPTIDFLPNFSQWWWQN